jgi:hypothetical protein
MIKLRIWCFAASAGELRAVGMRLCLRLPRTASPYVRAQYISQFKTIPSALKAEYFLNHKTPPTDPDDD